MRKKRAIRWYTLLLAYHDGAAPQGGEEGKYFVKEEEVVGAGDDRNTAGGFLRLEAEAVDFRVRLTLGHRPVGDYGKKAFRPCTPHAYSLTFPLPPGKGGVLRAEVRISLRGRLLANIKKEIRHV